MDCHRGNSRSLMRGPRVRLTGKAKPSDPTESTIPNSRLSLCQSVKHKTVNSREVEAFSTKIWAETGQVTGVTKAGVRGGQLRSRTHWCLVVGERFLSPRMELKYNRNKCCCPCRQGKAEFFFFLNKNKTKKI